VAQAKNYAAMLAVRYAYSTNGQSIYGVDMTGGAEGEVPQYPGPEELWNLTFAERCLARPLRRRALRGQRRLLPARYYQDIAIGRVLRSPRRRKPSHPAHTATGTGQTFIAFIIDACSFFR